MKMLNTLRTVAIIGLMGLSGWATAQIDEERMDRDLKIAENILNTLAKENSDGWNWYSNNIESNYMEGFGVVFMVPEENVLIVGQGNYVYSSDGSYLTVRGSKSKTKIKSTGSGKSKTITSIEVAPDDEVVIEEVDGDEDVLYEMPSEEETNKKLAAITKARMITFLTDYADLIGQLEPSDRIVIQTKSKNNWGRKTSSRGISGQVLKSDLTSYKSGKISRDKLIEKIEFTESAAEAADKDVELFSTIFARLYEPDMSKTYYSASKNISYAYLDNYGVTFNMKFYSSSSDNGIHTIRSTGQSGLSQEERNIIVNDMYPDFIESFKSNLIDYGRTVRSIESNEKLIFKVKLTECKGCDMPSTLVVTIDGKTLKEFDQGKLSRDKAISLIDVKES